MTPDGWRRVPLSAIAEVNPQRALARAVPSPFVDMAALPTEGSRISRATERVFTGSGSKFRNGDVLFARITPCVENGKTGLVTSLPASGSGFGSTEFIVLAARDGVATPEFVYHLARSRLVRDYAIEKMEGTSGRQRVPNRVFDEILVLVPTVAEQRRIADILSSVDDAIERTKAVIDQLAVVKKAMLHELLARGLPGRHTRFRQTEIGEVPEEWRIVPLGDVATIERGRFSHRPRNDPRFYGGPYPFIQTGDVAASDGTITNFTQTLNEDGLRMSKLFPAGTIVITIAANIGDTGIAMFPVAFPDSLVGIRAGDQVDNRFLELVLRSRKQALSDAAPQNAQKNINLQVLTPLSIPLPPLDEQREIRHMLDAVTERQNRERLLVEQQMAVKAALSSALLAGELRVLSEAAGSDRRQEPARSVEDDSAPIGSTTQAAEPAT